MENIKKKDNTYDFFAKYLSKYVAEISNFNELIPLNDDDAKLFMSAASIINSPSLYDEKDLIKALDIYDPLSFYISSSLLDWNFEKQKYYINPTMLAKKAFEGELIKSTDADDDRYELVSVYTKKA